MGRLLQAGYSKDTAGIDERARFDFWREVVCDEFVQLDCEQVRRGPFNGTLRGGVGIAGLRFSEVESDPQLVVRSRRQISRAAEDEFLISFQLRENGVVRQDGREARLAPGAFALYDSTRPYTLAFAHPFHQLVVQIPRKVLTRYLLNPERYTAVAIGGDSGLGAVFARFATSLATELHTIHEASEELSDNLITMMAMAFSSSVKLAEANSSAALRESLKRRVRQYIVNNLCDPGLTNERIARAQGISPRYLHKLFENEDESVHNLILTKRLQRARELLQDPACARHTVEQIAYSVGFSSASHFSRAFRAGFGVAPGSLRSRAAAND